MATAKPETDDGILTCPICFELFTNPKSLPCHHTYCKECLKSYIITQLGGDRTKAESFPCPVCRHAVGIDQNVTSEKFVDTLPGHNLIASLIDRSNVMKGGKFCDPCSVKSHKTTATWWCTTCQEAMCENCSNCHKQFKILRNHVTVAIGDVSSDAMLSVLETEEPCMKHSGNVLQAYCADHNEICCVVCLTTKHRKCEKVSTVEEMVTGINGDQMIRDFTESLDKIDKVTGELRIRLDENLNNLDIQHNEITQEVAIRIKKAKDNLDRLQVDFETKFRTKHKKQHLKLTEGKDRIEIFQQNVKKGRKLLDTVREVGSPKQLFIAKEKLQIQLQDQVVRLKTDTKDLAYVAYTLKIADIVPSVADSLTSVAEVDINPTHNLSDNITRVEDMVNGLGEDKWKCVLMGENESVDVTKVKVTKVCSIQAGYYEWFNGGTYLPDGRLILCNYTEMKAYDKDVNFLFRHNIQLRQLFTPKIDACCVSENEILVTKQSCITRFEVTKIKFKEKNTVSCNTYPVGVAVTKNDLIIGYEDKIEISSLDGQSRKVLSSKQHNRSSYVVTSSTDNVFYNERDTVVCKALNGTEMARYTNPELQGARGIAVDKYDNVYVCGSGSNNVCVFSPDGKRSKILIKSINNPRGIGFDCDGTKFFVTHTYGANIYTRKFV